MNADVNGGDALAGAMLAYQTALRDVAQTCKILAAELAELTGAASDLRRLGVYVQSYPGTLAQALAAQLRAWPKTSEGAAALGAAAPPTRQEELLANARADLAALEEHLARAKAIQPLTESMVDDRRRRIETTAEEVIRARRRVADLDPSDAAAFVAWLKAFGLELRKVLSNPPAIPRGAGGDTLALLDARDAAEARRADPLGALLADMTQQLLRDTVR